MSDSFAKQPTSLPPGAKAPGKDDEIIERRTLRDYYIILRERLWIALPLALTVALGLVYYQSRETPMYRSTATMHFDKSVTVLRQDSKVYNPDVENEVMLNTYIKMIGSETLRNQVRASLTPEEQKTLLKPFVKDLPPGATPPSVDVAMASPSVQSTRNNFIIEISVAHRDRDAAALLTNRYVDQFIQMLLNKVGTSNDEALVFLKKRAADLQQQAQDSDKNLADFVRNNDMITYDTSTNVVSARLMSANTDLQRARMEHRTIQDQLALIERYQGEKRNLLEINFIAGYGSIPDLRKQLEGLQRDQTLLAERYLERHPLMIKSASAIAVVQEQLDTAINLAIADLKTSLERSATIEQKQQAEYDAQEKELLHLRDLSVPYKVLADKKEADHKNFVEINDRLAQIVNDKYLESVPVSRLDSAHPSPEPYSPNLSSIVKTAVGIGVLVFFGVAVGLSFVDDRIKSAWDVETFIGANLLGIIPDLSGIKDEEKYRLVLGDQQGAGVEPFLAIYSAVKIHSKLDFPKSILITSTIPGEGKTLVSCNLAGSFARHGRASLLIDCDLRRPMLHRHYNKDNETGLIKWFENGASTEGDLLANPHLGITSVGENLFLLTSGGRSKSPTKLLESPAFAQLLERFKQHFELVVIDSPPMGAVTDALLIAERVDEVIYVCRFNRAYRKHIRLYIKALRSGKNEVLGLVLNGLSPRRIEYYSNYRYYRSYKKYYGSQS